GRPAAQINKLLIGYVGHDGTDAFGEGGGVELGADDLVGAVGEVGDAPVADEGDELLGLRGFDLGADMLGTFDAAVAFDIDQYKVVVPAPEHRETFFVGERRVDFEALEAKDVIAQGPDGIAGTDVKDGALRG